MQAALDIQFKNTEQVQSYARTHQRTLLILDHAVLDVTTFAPHHPGGQALLHTHNLERVDEQLQFHHPLTLRLADSMAIGSLKKELTHLVDPNQALLSQLWNLTHEQYLTLIHSPQWLLEPSPRMFASNFLEPFSHSKWYHVLPLQLLTIAYLFYLVPHWDDFHLPTFLLTALAGFLTFTLAEYLIHRFLFHSETHIPDFKLARFAHFMLHGVHHILPLDPDRLVFPPALALIYMTIGYYTVLRVLQIHDPILFATFWSSFLLGYLTYDLTHYALHHIDTSKHPGTYFHRLQQYHNLHHFGAQHAGFGVSSKFWDIVFRTQLTTKKD